MQITTFNGGYGRKGTIDIVNPAAFEADYQPCCNVCKDKVAPLLTMDASEEEYNEGCICQNCINTAFENFNAVK